MNMHFYIRIILQYFKVDMCALPYTVYMHYRTRFICDQLDT